MPVYPGSVVVPIPDTTTVVGPITLLLPPETIGTPLSQVHFVTNVPSSLPITVLIPSYVTANASTTSYLVTSSTTNMWTQTGPHYWVSRTGDVYYFVQPAQTVTNATLRPKLPKPAVIRRRLLAGRKALRRSIELFCSLRPEHEIKAFLQGEPILVHGCRHDYRVKKRDDVLHHTMHPLSGHIPYDLHLMDRQTSKPLAKGCIVIHDTPVIDQVLALMLNVEDPDGEREVIRTTNWSPRLPESVLRAA